MIDQTDKQISAVVAMIKKLIDKEYDNSCVCYSHSKKLTDTADF